MSTLTVAVTEKTAKLVWKKIDRLNQESPDLPAMNVYFGRVDCGRVSLTITGLEERCAAHPLAAAKLAVLRKML